MNIPYTVEPRPDTGLHNGKLGIWLFLASEVMLFGALFSSYILLRVGAPEWPHGELSIPLGAINTVILISSSVTMVMAWASLKMRDWGLHRLHIVGGMIVMAYFLGPGAKLWKKNPDQFANRIEATGLYWHFVDLVWIFLFPVLYLL